MITKNTFRTRVPRKNLLLAELIIVLLFFSLAAAGCVKLFGLAYTDVNYSRNLTSAVIEAQNAAENFKAAGGDLEKAAQLIFDAVPRVPGIFIDFPDGTNKEINRVIDEDYSLPFNMRVAIKEDGSLLEAYITLYNNESVLYQLTTAAVKEG